MSNMIHSQCEDQKQFMTVMGAPTVRTHGRAAIELAKKLIHEECLIEFIPAIDKYLEHPSLENLVELADGAVDTVYVVFQLCNALELPFDKLFNEIHLSNMAKILPDGSIKQREDGKVLKPEGWRPPNLHAILLDWATIREYGQDYLIAGHVR